MITDINRWKVAFFVAFVLGIIALPTPSAQAQESTKVYRIGFLAFGHRPVGSAVAASPLVAFRQSLRELGYVEGRNLILDERWAETHLDRLPVLAAELVGLKPDVIVASGAGAVRAAKRATQQIPIVIAGAADPGRRTRDEPCPSGCQRDRRIGTARPRARGETAGTSKRSGPWGHARGRHIGFHQSNGPGTTAGRGTRIGHHTASLR